MKKYLLSIDWDYFIYTKKENWGSYIESNRNIINLWYKRYFQFKEQGKDFKKAFLLSAGVNTFWKELNKHFVFKSDAHIYVSDSHALAYDVAKENECDGIYLFDAHSDLGYGGLESLEFEVNCANWLGKLFKDKYINEADIIYSPFTIESPDDFKEISNAYNVNFMSINNIKKNTEISELHICRSGAWTPPWLDSKFLKFIKEAKLPYKVIDCSMRKWQPDGLTLGERIYYLMA
ncbi:hypothetical protein SAMN02745163_04377 [Clostridium cavendishii DSM 21758]|uniref:Uncharacterized protein n=1 Tax=Clostridium cavendishii DSM 21758 TaxID=1121302 RepID=A0A1M6UXD2_9CLOT|nr:arginase [Clostridium cavendishii]SHK73811.1 hypothetical protein SAMN02745163_04377 [Clostridium cavendishii DSM 21758]